MAGPFVYINTVELLVRSSTVRQDGGGNSFLGRWFAVCVRPVVLSFPETRFAFHNEGNISL